jgi:Uma2 family endonuclease
LSTLAAAEKLTRDRFREQYLDRKPYFELIDGVPEQKALGSRKHALLQLILGRMLDDLGLPIGAELTLEISEVWEPIPDLATITPGGGVYQDSPPGVAIEIISPTDRFTQVQKKVARYAEWGVKDILVFDPEERLVYRWDHSVKSLVLLSNESCIRFESYPVSLVISEVFKRLDEKLKVG